MARKVKKPRSVQSYKREVRDLLRWMADLQWVQPMYNGSPSCSHCGEQQHQHVDADCALSRKVAKLRDPGTP